MVPMQALPGHFCFTPHGHDWNFCVVMQKQLTLHVSLHLANWSDSLHIESRLTSKESSHSPVSTVSLVLSHGDLTLRFQNKLVKILVWKNHLLSQLLLGINPEKCYKNELPSLLWTYDPSTKKMGYLGFLSPHIFALYFFFPQEWENLNLKGNSMPFFILIHTTIIAEHACLILKIVNAGWFKSIHLLDWAKQFSELTLLKIFFKGWDNSKGIS